MSVGHFALIGIGCLVGVRHAFEPDHLAAVSMLATRERALRSAAVLGLAWGAGHTASVAVVTIIITVLGIRMPPAFAAVFELAVASMLIILGVSTLIAEGRRHRQGLGDAHAHAHSAHIAHLHPEKIRSAGGAFTFGIAHGLAGSGALIVLLVAAASTIEAQLFYLLAFGIGTVGGMSVVSLLVSGVTGLAVAKSRHWATSVRILAATASMIVGVMLGWSVMTGA